MKSLLKPLVYLPNSTFLTCGHVQVMLGVSRSLLHKWRRDKNFPRFYRQGRASLYLTSQIESWLHSRGVTVKTIED